MKAIYILTSLRIVTLVCLFLLIIATLFPPFEWNSKIEGIPGVYYSYSITSMKTYEFLFDSNQKKFYSDKEQRWMLFTRSIIITELLVEYLLIIFTAILFNIIFHHLSKKRIIPNNEK